MVDAATPVPGRIFISYRREETAYPAGWLYDRLADRYRGQVFKDVDSIELGDDFVEVITRAVGSCDVLLALVGDQWLTITDEDGRRRLDDPDDFVRLEIEAALTRNVRVIPILVDGARLPRAEELPPSMAGLVRRQALELSPARFDFDTSRLLKVLDKTLAEVRTAHDRAAAVSAAAGKTLDPSTEQPEPEQQERAEPSPTPSTRQTPGTPPTVQPLSGESKPADRSTAEVDSPVAPAVSAVAPTPSDQSQLPVKQRRRLSKRARILAGVGAGVALILLVVAIYAANSQKPVIFEDDFSSQDAGWAVRDASGTGDYTNGAYRVSAGLDVPWAIPKDASDVYPSTPASIGVEVTTAGASSDAQYGILCRVNAADDSAYAFLVENGSAIIVKHVSPQNTPVGQRSGRPR